MTTDALEWTAADSDQLDALIIAHTTERPPLRPDPRLYELFTPDRDSNRPAAAVRKCRRGEPDPDQRAAILLARKGWSGQQIAAHLGVAQRTVFRWRSRFAQEIAA